MNKSSALSTLVLFLLFSVCSCQPDPVPEPVPGVVENFSVQITSRQATQAEITWSAPTVPAGAVLQYNVYVSGNLKAQNLAATNYAIVNIVAGQTYSGRVVAYISPTDSSVANFTIPVFTPGIVPDSMFVLSGVTDAGGLRLVFNYDENNKRLSSWSKTYSSSYYDSTKIYYDAQGKVLSLVRKSTTSTPFTVTPNVFEYNGEGRVSKIYHKSLYSTDQGYEYLTSVKRPLDFVYDINSYDSLNYDAKNRVTSVYSFDSRDGNGLIPGFHTSYKLYTYTAANDSLLSKIETYTRNTSNTFTLSTVNFNAYNDKANPYYMLFRKFYLMGVYSTITTPTFLPYYFYGYDLNDDMTTNPYLCTAMDGSPLNYVYNGEGLVVQCVKAAATTDWVRFSYTKVRK